MTVRNFSKEYLPYLVTALAIILPWFFDSGYLFFTDLAWGPNMSLDWTSSEFLVRMLVWFFSFIFPADFLQKIYIGFAVFIVLMGGKKISGYFIKDTLGVFAVSLFAVFNPFVYDRLLYGQVSTVFALGFLLLSAGYLLEYLENRQSRHLIIFGVHTALALQFSAHFVFFIGPVFLLFLVLFFRKWGLNGNLKPLLKNLLVAGAVCILFNINWLVGDFVGKTDRLVFVDSGITTQDLLAFKTSGSSDSGVLRNVLMMSGFWGKDQHRYADLTTIKNNWGRSFLFLLPIIIFGLFLGLKKKETRVLSAGFLIILIISAVLASGISLSVSGPLSYWLFDHVPFYKGLRETQKWVSVVVLIYMVFLSIGTAALLKTKVISINRRASLLFLGAVIIMQAPFILWGFWGQSRPVQYPTDWTEVDKSLECSNNERILFLPWHAYMSFNWIGKIVANPSRVFFSCPTMLSSAMEWGGIYDNSRGGDNQKIYAWLSANGRDGLLKKNELGIRYIILAKELDWENYLWIEKLSGIKLVRETASLKVYETQ